MKDLKYLGAYSVPLAKTVSLLFGGWFNYFNVFFVFVLLPLADWVAGKGIKNHSWNSGHNVGRIVLYEFTRHVDHHFKSNEKNQVLNSYDEGPQLSFGYPTSILISFVPPLWFKVMNKRVPQEMIA